jgi:protein-disulfide isomerase
MEKNQMDDSRWVDSRMASLDAAADWQPDVTRALGQLRERHRAGRARRRNWICVLAATAAILIVLGIMEPRACANPRGCENAPQTAASAAVQIPVNFKQSGNPRAAITCEIYSDYECPGCAYFFQETMPLIVAEYVKTGKIKIVHRDYPWPQHPYARLAARYANAAGRIGRYDVVADRLFRTQEAWSVNGDIAGALAPALTPDEMKTVQRAVESDAHLDDTVAEDLAAAQKDQVGQTPTLIIVWKGKRQVIAPIPPFSLLKSYLDALLSQ